LDPAAPDPREALPLVALVVSGGHTSLFRCARFGTFKLVGRTIDDADEFVRAQAALSLGTIADPEAREPLDRMRREDPSVSAREAAAIAYKWLVGRLEEVEAVRGPKPPPPW
ncbi:MAG TPA: HEAT repeat domain-containing protein, partial [Methanoculleus sp.]|nr:HEAT repeat domain-containing protein [Methanoculleus sp.]